MTKIEKDLKCVKVAGSSFSSEFVALVWQQFKVFHSMFL